MPVRTARAEWVGDFRTGRGTITPGSGAFEVNYDLRSVLSEEAGSSPIEILGTAIAGCVSGALAAELARAGCIPGRICTDAEVHMTPPSEGYNVARIDLIIRAEAPGMDVETLRTHAESVKRSCPVAAALGGTEITLRVELA